MNHRPSPDDDPSDAHLHAALRHAPDATLEAPAALGARIRAAAHAAVRPVPWWRRWRAQPPWRLGASGAFATFALAGVIGLLWQGEPPPVQAPEPVAAAPAAPAPAVPAPAAETSAAPTAAANKTAVPAPPAATPAVARRERTAVTAEPTPAPGPAAAPAAAAPVDAPTSPPAPATATADAPRAVEAAPAPPPPHALTAPPERARALGLAPSPAGTWLVDLERSVAGAWRAEADEPPPLRRLGAVGIAFDGDRVWRCDGEAPRRCRSAALAADEAARLRTALEALR